MKNFIELFREEQNVWVKSMVPGQVSVSFETSPGSFVPICVPYSGDPVCLTDRVPFDAIKRSADFRTLCNPRANPRGGFKPPALEVMSEEEVETHFLKKAKRRKLFVKDEAGKLQLDDNGNPIPDVDAARAPRYTAPAASAPAVIPDKRDQLPPDQISDIAVSAKHTEFKPIDPVHPKVAALTHEIRVAETEKDIPLADVLLDEFESILPELNDESLEHLVRLGHYSTVKDWAMEQLASRGSPVEVE